MSIEKHNDLAYIGVGLSPSEGPKVKVLELYIGPSYRVKEEKRVKKRKFLRFLKDKIEINNVETDEIEGLNIFPRVAEYILPLNLWNDNQNTYPNQIERKKRRESKKLSPEEFVGHMASNLTGLNEELVKYVSCYLKILFNLPKITVDHTRRKERRIRDVLNSSLAQINGNNETEE
jgi:hypothetical protein